MSGDPAEALQTALFALLDGSVGGSPGIRCYGAVPPATEPPYLTIGDDSASDWGDKSGQGWDFLVTVNAYSRASGGVAGRTTVKGFLGEVAEILVDQEAAITAAGLTAAGFYCVLCRLESTSYPMGGDGSDWQGIHIYRVLIAA